MADWMKIEILNKNYQFDNINFEYKESFWSLKRS